MWNVAKYKSASYFKVSPSGQCLAEHARNKLIVILNDKFMKDQGRDTHTTMDFMDKEDLINAALHFNVSTLVIGEKWNYLESI